MIKPNKYTDVNSSVLFIASEILKILNARKLVTYTELQNLILSEKGENVKRVFLPALSFLYLLGKLEYHKEKDVIEFKNEDK